MDAVQRVQGLADLRCPESDGLFLHLRNGATWEQVKEKLGNAFAKARQGLGRLRKAPRGVTGEGGSYVLLTGGD